MRVVEIPTYLEDKGFDAVAGALGPWPPDGRILFDARATRWASPFGFTAMLTAGQALKALGAEQPRLTLPESEDVRSYWAKTGFFAHAEGLFELHGRVPRRRPGTASDILLPITRLGGSEDVHAVVTGIQEQAARILTADIHLAPAQTIRFSMALSEACQNVIEHAGTSGWVAVHTFNYRKRLGRRAVEIAVCDGGIGFRASLEASQARKVGDRWGDAAAVEAALIHHVSRFPDPGRGQGLAAIARMVKQLTGKFSIRSGTARVAVVPPWDDDVPLAEHLPYFPGAQVQIVVPSQETGP